MKIGDKVKFEVKRTFVDSNGKITDEVGYVMGTVDCVGYDNFTVKIDDLLNLVGGIQSRGVILDYTVYES